MEHARTATPSQMFDILLIFYINISVMPVVASFDPRPVVHLFLRERKRRVKETPKADKQAWF